MSMTIKTNLTRKIKINTQICQNYTEVSTSKKECSLITEEIYLSCYRYSLDYEFLKNTNFTHIINCAAGSKRFKTNLYPDFKYLLIDLQDEPNAEIEDTVTKVVNFIENANEECPNRKILIHCYEGISRAPMVLSSYLMWKHKINKDEAIKRIKQKRECVDINLGFIFQMAKLEEKFIIA